MKPARRANPRRSRRTAYLASATAVVGSTLAFSVPNAGASGSLVPGNLLVSTSVYTDLPAITAGTTALPVSPNSFAISNVTWSGITDLATITTKANGYVPGQTVLISGVGGATGVNGTWTIVSVPSTTTFTVSLTTNPGTFTSGGGVSSTQLGVTAVTWSGVTNLAAITTAANAAAYVPGQTVVIAGVGGATGVNGTWTVAATPAPTTTSFSFSLTTNPGTYTTGGTVTANIAIAPNTYPTVFNNDAIDANFGITEPIVLDQIPATTALVTTPISTITIPNSDSPAADGDQLVTSFSSKSELAVNQSTDGQDVSFVGYDAPTAAIDVSNSNTPSEQDPTNTDLAGASALQGYYRDAAVMNANGNFQFTEVGAYPGNNGRAAILNPANNTLFIAGNAGNGATPTYQGVVIGSGSQITAEATTSEASQDASDPTPTPYGNFNITQLGKAADKSTKDDNFRGLTQYNGVIYMSKGSGSNGINTVYFVDPTGTACPSGGIGVPQSGAGLPSAPAWTSSPLYPTFNTSNTSLGLSSTNPGLSPTNMCVLNGFSTTLASAASKTANNGVTYPFGLWFANPTTLYVADEGSGNGGTGDNTGGLQKWVLNTSTNTWALQYTLAAGLNLQTTYSVNPSPAGVNGGAAGQTFPTGTNSTFGGGGKAWAPATDGLRNIVGRINGDGTVTIWGVTSTISGSGDQGADPNQVVAITDSLAATTLPSTESFSQVLAPTDGVVYRGVAFTPTTEVPDVLPEVPWVPLIPISVGVIGGGFVWLRRRWQVGAGLEASRR
jgi:hypothetical protein